jgi:hypothetical protein
MKIILKTMLFTDYSEKKIADYNKRGIVNEEMSLIINV